MILLLLLICFGQVAGQTHAPISELLTRASVEYRRENYQAAKSHLERALSLDSDDAAANDFLATLYFLEGNTEAALKYWNRAGKPRIEQIISRPDPPPVDPVLLDRAIAFAPSSVLELADYRTTRAWLASLGPVWRNRIELVPRPGKNFDAHVNLTSPDGWTRLFGSFRSLPYQAVHADVHNLGGDAINWTNMFRWDAQKRRVLTLLSVPLPDSPRSRVELTGDIRREVWNRGAGDFRFSKTAGRLEFVSIPNGTLSWRTGVQVSSDLSPALSEVPQGTVLKYLIRGDYALLDLPEHRLSIGTSGSLDVGRVFASDRSLFSRVQVSMDTRWFPKARGRDYETRVMLRAGKGFGRLPLDDLFALGTERDTDLWLRGHRGTRDGKKGSALFGESYALANLECSKQIYAHPFFSFHVGPFVDLARIGGAFVADPGVQASVQLLGGVTLRLSYGGQFYSWVER